jgi:tetratricopeptide (TPR) repeat protein
MDVGEVQSPDGFYLVWTPGMVPTPPAKGAGWRLERGADLVLQLHMQPTGKVESVRPKIGLFFSAEPPTQVRFMLRVGDPLIDIPPGEKNHVVTDEYVLPAAANVLSLFPHAHFLARRIKCWAKRPDGTTVGLLRIDDWDFNWQDKYTFKQPVALPEGTRIAMEIAYDNSADNPRNPSRPPRRVKLGEQSTDEMGNISFEVEPRDGKLVNRLREEKYRRALSQKDSAWNHYNLANALTDLGLFDEAKKHFERALAQDPKLQAARFNLVRLHVNQGNAKKEQSLDAAIAHYRDGLGVDPASALAHNSLALALLEKGDAAGAIPHFRAALTVEPDNALSHFFLGNALRSRAQEEDALVHYRRALELRPGWPEARAALEAHGGAGDAGPPPR